MPGNLISDRPPAISLLIIFAGFILGTLLMAPSIGSEIAGAIYNVDVGTVLLNPETPEARGSILLAQGIGAVLGMILLPLWYLALIERKPIANLFKSDSQWIVVCVVLVFSVTGLAVAISPIIEWNAGLKLPESLAIFERMEEIAASITKAITNDMTPLSFLGTFIVVAIIPGVGEELVFRGLIQTELQRATRNPHVAIWIAAALFSAFHFQLFGFVPRMLIGAFLGYLYYWSSNLWIPIIGHFLNNGLQLIGLYLYQEGVLNFDVESTDSAPLPLVAGAIVVTTATLWFLKTHFRKSPHGAL